MLGASFYHVESNIAVPEGRHKLRFEFEVTGKPDIGKGKGAPGRGQLYIDGKLVGQADIPLTMPLSHWACRRHCLRRRHRLAGLGQIQTAVQVHRHALRCDRGREWRDDQGHGSRDAHGHGAAVIIGQSVAYCGALPAFHHNGVQRTNSDHSKETKKYGTQRIQTRSRVPRHDRANSGRLIAGLARTQPRQDGFAQRDLLDHRRRGLWADVRLRRTGQHAQH